MDGGRSPQPGRTTAKRRPPARGALQIIDNHVVVSREHTRIRAGSSTLEIGCIQKPVFCERTFPNIGDPLRDGDGVQITVCECPGANGDQACAQRSIVKGRPSSGLCSSRNSDPRSFICQRRFSKYNSMPQYILGILRQSSGQPRQNFWPRWNCQTIG